MVLVFSAWAQVTEETEATQARAARMHREGMFQVFSLAVAVRPRHNSTYVRDYPGNYDHSDHPSDGGGPPVIDLGPTTQSGDQPQPEPEQEPSGGDTGPKPGTDGPGDQPGINTDDGNKSADTGKDAPLQPSPDSAQPYPPPADTSNSAPPPKQEPDHGESPGESPPDIPIFLGPTNNHPSPEGQSQPSGPPQGSSYPDEKERHRYPDDPPCDEHFSGSLINLLSNNGGDGGDASSGAATRQETTPLFVHSLT
jgi:hypothetical protein